MYLELVATMVLLLTFVPGLSAQCVSNGSGPWDNPIINLPNSNVLAVLYVGQMRGTTQQTGITESCENSFLIRQGTKSVSITTSGQWVQLLKLYGNETGSAFIRLQSPSYSILDNLSLHGSGSFPLPGWTPDIQNMTPDYVIMSYFNQVSLNVSDLTATGDFQATITSGLTTGDQPVLAFTVTITADDDPSFITAVDPVPYLATENGTGIVDDPDRLTRYGTPVDGVAADDESKVVLRIPAKSNGDLISVQLINDQGQVSSSEAADGVLESLDGATRGSQLQVTAVDTTAGPMALCIYLSPGDFSRGGADDNVASRTVSVNATALSASSAVISKTLTIWRPPVVLVHGLWGDPQDWQGFAPFNNQSNDSQFFTRVANYTQRVNVSTVTPAFGVLPPQWVQANALSYVYNAPAVLQQIKEFINEFRVAKKAAATQADIVGHSMGGLVAREIQTLPQFADPDSYGAGAFHKIITIGTPHRGSPVPRDLLDPANYLLAFLLATKHKQAVKSATVGGVTIDGAVNDLQGDAAGNIISNHLNDLNNAVRQVPSAYIAGVMSSSNLASLSFCNSLFVQAAVGPVCLDAPLTAKLTPNGWPTEFGNNGSDAIVPLISELNGSTGITVPGLIHSTGVEALGFTGPAELDANSNVATNVLLLLNAPQSSNYFHLLP